jgi:hypothetical protein
VKPRLAKALLLMLLAPAPAAHAEPPADVQIEVNFLLGYVDGSSCAFFRNGSWHDSHAAQAHLRTKYKYLVARNLVHTTEDFIEMAATESSISGQPYLVKCNGTGTVTSSQWLHEELGRFRAFK